MARCVITFLTPTLTHQWIGCCVCLKDNLNWLPSLDLVHDWLTCLHISHHAVTVFCRNVSFYIFFLPFPRLLDFLSLYIQLTKAHRQGHMVKVDWLDRLTFREIEMINEVRRFAAVPVCRVSTEVF